MKYVVMHAPVEVFREQSLRSLAEGRDPSEARPVQAACIMIGEKTAAMTPGPLLLDPPKMRYPQWV